MLERSTRNVIGLLAVSTLVCGAPPAGADFPRLTTVPALIVGEDRGQAVGGLEFIVIQVDSDPQGRGPTILFSEKAQGSAVSEDWKAGVRLAVLAAAAALGEDARAWRVTIKNRAPVNVTSGTSASSVIAVGVMAAWRRETVRPDIVLTGEISADGRISEVDMLPAKLAGAARGRMRVLLVPKGQARTAQWDLYQLGRERDIAVVEVGSLQEAYELMTGKRPIN
jgi:predicted ATP-dependent protease